MRNVDKLNDDNFKRMNALIAEYNGKLDRYKSQPGGGVFSVYPRISPVLRESVAKVKKWQHAKANQARLAQATTTLDEERSRIDEERDALIQEGQSIHGQEAELQKLSAKLRQAGPTPGRRRTSCTPR